MKKILVIALVLVTVCIVSVCSHQNNESASSNITQKGNSERNKLIDEYKNKYSAVDFYTENKNISFSAEMLDKYKGKNMYASFYSINDVFYSDNDMVMYAEGWGDNKFALKITPEQFSKIKNFEEYVTLFDFHAIFCLDNIASMFPSLNADFSFDVITPEDDNFVSEDDILFSEDTSVSFDSKIIQGTLIDIIEIK